MRNLLYVMIRFILVGFMFTSWYVVANPRNDGNEPRQGHQDTRLTPLRQLTPEANRILNAPPPVQSHVTTFESRVTDRTAYPYIQTTLNFVEGHLSYKAFLSDGQEISYSTRGEHIWHSQCYGDLCILVTNKNLLGVSNSSSEWEKGHHFGEERYRVAMGHKAALVMSERKLYLFNSYTNHWETISLEQEIIRSFANLYDKVAITTTRRMIVIDLPSETQFEENLLLRGVYQFEMRDAFINFYSSDKLWMFRHQTQNFEEVDLMD
ncbi:hypothetical protein [Leptospira kanakyensis]|uniref:Uncharacterized protein n=1 Tax=Leptospira kanakyensis TaxID=2484968 RepID=A0A6N4Q9A7_9LEPT|nr:hypothetical protein [Leptospira kanakyensis]MCW7479719.1 hypothetical protein [Leptospira kanakyensis]TGK49956.1 hypothetical protein EHQ11_09495 [Leptospira kanakyensis]TGK58527.1 hypothetical protein EHQ16_13125 [Leptospira kanakyensis]TGK69094.1 hypothetical protein EHQ18_09655 [Leptospira kanakyensis]